MEPLERIRQFLADVRRELNRISAQEALLAVLSILGLTTFVALAFALFAADGEGPWGWALILAGLVLAGLATWRLWARPRRARAADDELALWIESRVDGLDSGLVTSVQTLPLIRDAGPDAQLGFSACLAREAAARTCRGIAGIRAGRLGERRRLGRLAGGFAAVAALLVVVGLLAPDFYGEGGRRLITGPLEVAPEGERYVSVAVGQLTLEIIPPAYTNLEPRKLDRTAGDIEALAGSEVRFAAAALYPATEVAMVLESSPEDRWAQALGADGTVRGGFHVDQPDRYQFVLTEPDGTVVRERTWRAVSARADAAPEVQLLLPESDLEVKPTDDVAFFFEASDDYGLDRVELVVMSDRGQELGRATVRAPKGERLCRGDHTVSVARLGLEAGDSAEVWFEAVDLNSLTGPGVTRSQARRLTLYSPEAEHERLLARLDAVIDAMIDVLADRLESPVEERDRFRLRDYVSIGQGISAKQGKILNSLTALLGGLSTDALASQELRDGIRQVRDRLQDVQDQEAVHLRKAVIGSATAHDRVMVSLLYGANEEGVAETETGVLTLDELLDQSRKDSILDAGRELLETQHEIMELLKKIKDTKDPEALQQAMKKLDRLQKKLAKLQDELSKLRERVPYENQNRSQRPSDNQVSMKDMKSTMDRIQELLAQGKVDEAMKLLEELNKSTQELMASLQDDLERGGGMSAAAQQKAQELSTKLDELADGQRGLRSETGEVDRQISERQARQLQQRAKQALESAKAQAEALKQTLEGVDRAPLHDSDREALEALEEAAESLEQEVADGKVGEAAERARELAEQVEALEREVGESEARELDEARLAGLKAGREELDKGQAQAEALAKELAGLQPKPGEGLEPGEASEVKRLGERQEQLRERLKQLKDALPELDKEMPGIEAEMSEPLDKAGQSMSEARDQLGDKRPGKASDKQQEALEQIEKAQQKMSEQMQQRQAGNDGQEQQGPNDPNAKVEIPKEDPYATPRDFRRELLDAMRERAPDQYRDAIEEFYKGLMK